jgi:hypothetical protein
MTYWTESLGRIELNITKKQAEACSHPGECSQDVAELLKVPAIRRQLNKLAPHLVAVCLKEYGVWDDDELLDHEENLSRLLWVACCDISEGNS